MVSFKSKQESFRCQNNCFAKSSTYETQLLGTAVFCDRWIYMYTCLSNHDIGVLNRLERSESVVRIGPVPRLCREEAQAYLLKHRNFSRFLYRRINHWYTVHILRWILLDNRVIEICPSKICYFNQKLHSVVSLSSWKLNAVIYVSLL